MLLGDDRLLMKALKYLANRFHPLPLVLNFGSCELEQV